MAACLQMAALSTALLRNHRLVLVVGGCWGLAHLAPHDLRVREAPQLPHDEVEGEGVRLLQADDGHLLPGGASHMHWEEGGGHK